MSKLYLRVAKRTNYHLGLLGRIIAIIPLTLTIVNLIIAVTLPIFEYDRFLERAIDKFEGRGFLKHFFDNVSGFFWQQVTPHQIAQNEIWWNQFWAVVYLVVSIIFCWVIFNWYQAKYIISGVSAVVLGIIYSFLPVDILPDFIPAAGSFDDVIVLLISSGTGFTILREGGEKGKILRKAQFLAEEKPIKTLEMLCEEYGLELDIKPDSQKINHQ